jgi:hypothetical protein
MKPALVDQIVRDADDLRHRMEGLSAHVVASAEGAERSFTLEREAERLLLLDLLQAVRPALKWISDYQAPVAPLSGEHRQVVLDAYRSGDGPSYEWVAFDHPELGVAVGRKDTQGTELAWPGGADLPFGREGGPRLARVVCNLADRLAAHAQGNTSRRRREAVRMTERLRAIQTLLRGP